MQKNDYHSSRVKSNAWHFVYREQFPFHINSLYTYWEPYSQWRQCLKKGGGRRIDPPIPPGYSSFIILTLFFKIWLILGGSGQIWLDDVICDGTELSLDGCQHRGWGNTRGCSHSEDVAIMCYVPPSKEIAWVCSTVQ